MSNYSYEIDRLTGGLDLADEDDRAILRSRIEFRYRFAKLSALRAAAGIDTGSRQDAIRSYARKILQSS